MHIAFLTSEYPPLNTGGIGTSIQTLAHELVRQGHRITVLGLGKKNEWEDAGVKVKFFSQTRIPKMGWILNRLRIAREINRMILEEGLDIVEAPDWTGLSAGMKLNCPLVIRCHGSDTYFGNLLGYRPRWSVKLAETIALRQADCILAVSQFTASTTQKIFHLMSPIEVIPNGVNLQNFQCEAEDADNCSILYFGTLVRKKGILDLARIFSLIVEKIPQARLILAGRDAADKVSGSVSTWELFKQSSSPKAFERTEYVGPKNHGELKRLIQKASVCVFPSYAEALPVSWLEAMSCGKAVIASNIGWAGEIIEDGVSGFLVHPGDHSKYAEIIENLLSEPKKRKMLESAARVRVEDAFNIQVVAQKSVDLYARTINERRL